MNQHRNTKLKQQYNKIKYFRWRRGNWPNAESGKANSLSRNSWCQHQSLWFIIFIYDNNDRNEKLASVKFSYLYKSTQRTDFKESAFVIITSSIKYNTRLPSLEMGIFDDHQYMVKVTKSGTFVTSQSIFSHLQRIIVDQIQTLTSK